jgi:hypothetical protein
MWVIGHLLFQVFQHYFQLRRWYSKSRRHAAKAGWIQGFLNVVLDGRGTLRQITLFQCRPLDVLVPPNRLRYSQFLCHSYLHIGENRLVCGVSVWLGRAPHMPSPFGQDLTNAALGQPVRNQAWLIYRSIGGCSKVGGGGKRRAGKASASTSGCDPSIPRRLPTASRRRLSSEDFSKTKR